MKLVHEGRSTGLIREAREALARFDAARLQEIVIESGRLADGEVLAIESRVSDGTELEAFAALLEMTRENITIVRRPGVSASFHLEYQPFATRAHEGATY